MLATNSLKQDLNHKNQYIVGLALCTIGNLATPDMSRDLATEVDKHLRAGSPYLRKKAALAMARCLTKVPDMVEDFVERIVTLLKDRTHGVLITAVQLMIRVCEIDPEVSYLCVCGRFVVDLLLICCLLCYYLFVFLTQFCFFFSIADWQKRIQPPCSLSRPPAPQPALNGLLPRTRCLGHLRPFSAGVNPEPPPNPWYQQRGNLRSHE